MSKSTVSAVCDQVKYEYAAWAGGRLDGVTLDYLFLDASFFRMHPGSRPSRCWRPGASPPAASPRSSAWRTVPASPLTPGMTSWLISRTAA